MSTMEKDSFFVNRAQELKYIKNQLSVGSCEPSTILLLSPSGIGKSSLTGYIQNQVETDLDFVIVVDPNIRTDIAPQMVFEGYFLRRTAEVLAGLKKNSFKKYVESRKWKTAKNKDYTEAVRKMPSTKHVYSLVVDYIERMFSLGKYSADELLQSSSSLAINTCREYLFEMLADVTTMIIVREAQHIDHESFEFYFALQRELKEVNLIFEYTDNLSKLSSGHEKIFYSKTCPNTSILRLQKLPANHLEYLLNQRFSLSVDIDTDVYAQWDGNLRSLTEIEYLVSTSQNIGFQSSLTRTLPNFKEQLSAHTQALNKFEKLIMLVLVVHEEKINARMLFSIIKQIDNSISSKTHNKTLTELDRIHGFINLRDEYVSIDNEDITNTLLNSKQLKGLHELVKERLRDFYLETLSNHQFMYAPQSLCIRQAFSLCASTKDISGIIHLINILSKEIKYSNDQKQYIDIIIDSLKENENIFEIDKLKVTEWASDLAYEIGDFAACVFLLEKLWSKSPTFALYYIHSLMEIGKHKKAHEVLEKSFATWQSKECIDAFHLTKAILYRIQNNKQKTQKLINEIIESSNGCSKLLGFAYRFMETVSEFPEATKHVLESIRVFQNQSLPSAEAYSRLALAMHLSRSGNPTQALDEIKLATKLLKYQPKDSHIILNNTASCNLYMADIVADQCIKALNRGLSYAQEDFSKTVIWNNLGIIFCIDKQFDKAVNAINHALEILEAPSFGDQDIMWAIYFNAAYIYRQTGQIKKGDQFLNKMKEGNKQPIIYPEYWLYRYGLSKQRPCSKFDFMLSLPYNPLFISHWQIDGEVLRDLH